VNPRACPYGARTAAGRGGVQSGARYPAERTTFFSRNVTNSSAAVG